MNELLSICIPTYNRAATLREGLSRLIPVVSPLQIAIHVADNHSTDETAQVVAQAQVEYPLIRYHRNASNLGMDGNFEIALRLAETRYAWLLGDDDRIAQDAVREVVSLISGGDHYTFILLNGGSARPAGGRVAGRPSRRYTEANSFLQDLGWHATWISGLVLSTSLIKQMDFKPYIGSYFSHFGSLFTALSQMDALNVYWHEPSCYFPASNASFSWAPRVLEIFAEKWCKAVLSLPGTYALETKHHCIKAHSRHTGIFSVKGLLNLRAQGAISESGLDKYLESFTLASHTDIRLARLIARLPVGALRGPREAYVALRQRFFRPAT